MDPQAPAHELNWAGSIPTSCDGFMRGLLCLMGDGLRPQAPAHELDGPGAHPPAAGLGREETHELCLVL